MEKASDKDNTLYKISSLQRTKEYEYDRMELLDP